MAGMFPISPIEGGAAGGMPRQSISPIEGGGVSQAPPVGVGMGAMGPGLALAEMGQQRRANVEAQSQAAQAQESQRLAGPSSNLFYRR